MLNLALHAVELWNNKWVKLRISAAVNIRLDFAQVRF
jgi:hypothetical protein